MSLRNASSQLASSQLGSGGRLLWEWNGTDVSQFGDGDGTPNAVTGTETGTLAASTLSSPNTDATAENVLLYTHTGGTADVFFTINDLPPLPERYLLQVQLGPRNGSSYGLNTIPSVVLAFQDATHFIRVGSTSSSNNDFRMFTGNGDVGSASVSSFSTQLSVTPVFADDAGVIVEAWCMLAEPDTGVDPRFHVTLAPVQGSGKLDVRASTHGWTAQGGATAPSTSWDSGWQSGGSIRRPGIWFRELGTAGKGYIGMFKIFEV